MNRIIDLIIAFFKKRHERKKKIDRLLDNCDILEDSLAGRRSFTDAITELTQRIKTIEKLQDYEHDVLNTILIIVNRRRSESPVVSDRRRIANDRKT